MVPLFVRLSRRLKSLNTARRFTFLIVFIIVVMLVLSAVRTLSRDPVLVFGNVRNAVRLLLEVLSLFLLLLPSLSDLLFKDFVVLRLKLKPLLQSWNSHLLFIFTNNSMHFHKDLDQSQQVLLEVVIALLLFGKPILITIKTIIHPYSLLHTFQYHPQIVQQVMLIHSQDH